MYGYPLQLLRTLCGEMNRSAQTDVCLVQGTSTILPVVQEDKITTNQRDPEAQVIAEAIAAFQHNNRDRERLGETELDSMTIPSIPMIDTRPIFYEIPVTKQLSEAVATAQYSAAAHNCQEMRCCIHESSSERGYGDT